MATSESNYLGYNTYILGTARNVKESLRIIVYNREKLSDKGVAKLSIYNLDSVISQLKSLRNKEPEKEYYTELYRGNSEEDTPFHYSNDGSGIQEGFNTIIYLSNSDGSGVGYTEFITTQGEYRGINIYIGFTSDVSTDLELKIVNSLSQLQGSSTTSREWTGDKNYDYTTLGEVRKWGEKNKGKNKSLYTSHLQALWGKGDTGVWNDTGIILRRGETTNLHRLKISKNIPVDPYSNHFPRYQIGYFYNGDLAFYNWDGLKYSIFSLCETNRFGNPTNYTSGSALGYLEIPGAVRQGDQILYFSGRYAVVCLGGETRFYDTVSRRWVVQKVMGNVFIDTFDPTSKLTELPKIPYVQNVISSVPEVLNTFYDIFGQGKTYYLNIVRKYGDWFVFLHQRSIDSDPVYIFSSTNVTVTVSPKELDSVILFNDNYLGIKSEEGELKIYTELRKNYITPLAAKILGNRPMEGEEGIIKLGPEEILMETWLKKFQRNCTSTLYPKVSDVVGAWSGIVFYKLNNYLNYL